jgi:hypothetical protein
MDRNIGRWNSRLMKERLLCRLTIIYTALDQRKRIPVRLEGGRTFPRALEQGIVRQTVSATEGRYLSQEKHKHQKVKLECPASHGQPAMNI